MLFREKCSINEWCLCYKLPKCKILAKFLFVFFSESRLQSRPISLNSSTLQGQIQEFSKRGGARHIKAYIRSAKSPMAGVQGLLFKSKILTISPTFSWTFSNFKQKNTEGNICKHSIMSFMCIHVHTVRAPVGYSALWTVRSGTFKPDLSELWWKY